MVSSLKSLSLYKRSVHKSTSVSKRSNKPRPQKKPFHREGRDQVLTSPTCLGIRAHSVKLCLLVLLSVNKVTMVRPGACEWVPNGRPGTPSQQCKCSWEGKGGQCDVRVGGAITPSQPTPSNWDTRDHSALEMTQFIPAHPTSAPISQAEKLTTREWK